MAAWDVGSAATISLTGASGRICNGTPAGTLSVFFFLDWVVLMWLFVLIYLAVGYRIFWAGLTDDLAHIPSTAAYRALFAFTFAPAALLALFGFSAALNIVWQRNHVVRHG